MNPIRRRAALFAAGTALALTAAGAAAQSWPARQVRIVVPFAAGGTTDVVARLVGQKLGEVWGQPVVIENRGGAGGNVGADVVAKSAPDGYTLLMASGSILTVNPHMYRRMPFDAKKDFAPITNVATGPMLVVVHPAVAADSIKALIALARAKPGSINFGSAGVGSQVHMAAENFANAARIDIVHVPYKGEALGYNDLVAGQIHMMVGNMAAAVPFVNAGKLRALAVTGRTRSAMLPNVPTVAESGLPGFENTGWFGFVAPAGTPAEVIDRVQRDTARILETTEMKARLYVQGMTPVGDTPAAFARAIDAESARWARVVAERKLSAN
ncbi:MAG: tripartite tricarboxylate transporter substrate binding protein [Burkholderiales bacterium]|nr:tripartite tricarboxylate transporter substrate binding protein [Burkholderiales bacterium]